MSGVLRSRRWCELSAGTMRTLKIAGNSAMVRSTSSGTSPSISMTTMAMPPRLSRYSDTVPMLMPACAKRPDTCASTPGSSFCLMMRLVLSPVMLTATPSTRRSSAAPPPMETPRTLTRMPVASTASMSTVLGWSVLVIGSHANSNSRPCERASLKDVAMRVSSVCMPSMPATRALSVPCPL